MFLKESSGCFWRVDWREAGMEGVRSAGTKFRGVGLTSVVSSWI